MEENKKETYIEDFNGEEDLFSYENEKENNDVDIEEKIGDFSYEYMIFIKKYIKDECLSIAENISYNELFDFMDKIILK
jgi:hypothetical protein